MRSGDLKKIKARILLVASFFVCLFMVMILRSYQLQLFIGEELGERADRQLTRKISIPPVRGKIFDRNGKELATNRETYSVYVQPPKISDPEGTAALVSKILKKDEGNIKHRFLSKKSFVWIDRDIDSEKGEKIAALQLDGVKTIKERRRYYPNMELAGHLIGFAGVDSQGLEGIELEYDEYIKGNAGYFIVERDALGRNIYPRGLNVKDSTTGNNVTLTIDKTIQHVTERELGNAVRTYSAKGGMALVMDPHSGEVLAMAIQPVFDPNRFKKAAPSIWRNRVVTDTFEPGSTFKIFLVASAIESGKVGVQDIFYCENGRFRVYDRYIHDAKKYSWLSVENILKVSSNIGAFKIAEKIGKKDFYSTISNFGFGDRTGVDFPGEAKGFLRPAGKISQIGFANLSFGQGVSVSSLQLVNAISAVANGGYMMKPYIVKRITDGSGRTIYSNFPVKVRQVISEDTAHKVTAMLKRVISGEGTGVRAALEGYQVAGKTGTSQKYDAETGRYSRDRHISSFVGFVPADDPKLSILVVLDEPKEHYYGGTVAAPVFRRIAEQSLAHMKVVPLEEKNLPSLYQVKMVKNESPLSKKKGQASYRGGGASTPDLRGLTMREILVRMGRAPSEVSGSGVVVEQSPAPGDRFDPETGYRVRLGGKVSSGRQVAL